MLVRLKKVNKKAILPARLTDASSGYDLSACLDSPIYLPGKYNDENRVIVPTGIAIEIPKGCEAQIRSRSGLAIDHGISVLNSPGTIDSDFRGEIKIILINFGVKSFIIEHGMRIAQVVFAKCEKANFKIVTELDETTRNTGGFGSTGK